MSLPQRVMLSGIFAFAAIIGAYDVAISLGLRINIEESMPLGLYWFIPGPVKRGDIVQSCLTRRIETYAFQHHYLIRGGSCPDGLIPVVKVLAATSNDAITISPRDVEINGRAWPTSAIRTFDSSGNKVDLRLPLGQYKCPQNQVFLMGEHPRSWDSRYWGCVPQSTIAGRWLPVPFTGWIVSLLVFFSKEYVS